MILTGIYPANPLKAGSVVVVSAATFGTLLVSQVVAYRVWSADQNVLGPGLQRHPEVILFHPKTVAAGCH